MANCKDNLDPKVKAGNTTLGGRLSTVDLLIKVDCFIKKLNIFNINWADLNYLAQGGQPYWAFPLSKTSLVKGLSPASEGFAKKLRK
jgi:hypothetical protein